MSRHITYKKDGAIFTMPVSESENLSKWDRFKSLPRIILKYLVVILLPFAMFMASVGEHKFNSLLFLIAAMYGIRGAEKGFERWNDSLNDRRNNDYGDDQFYSDNFGDRPRRRNRGNDYDRVETRIHPEFDDIYTRPMPELYEDNDDENGKDGINRT